MATSSELKRVRKVLDFVPSSEMRSWKGRAYFEALNRRLNREVAIEQTEVRTTRPGRDEAVLVVAPEEWDAAQEARRRQAESEAELERVRQELEEVHARSADLQREVEELRQRLSGLKVEEEKRKTQLKLIGVRRPSLQASVATTTGAAEAVAESPAEPTPSEPSKEELEAAGWVVVPEGADQERPLEALEEPIQLRDTVSEPSEAEQAIQRVEDEILKIETELANLAQREQVLRRRAQRTRQTPAAKGPYEFRGYRLYQRVVGSGERQRPLYFFSKGEPETGEALYDVPDGYVVASNARNGMPYLKRAGGAKRRPRKARRKRAA